MLTHPQKLPMNTNSASKFRATVLWHNLVGHIHRNVKQKRRRLILKGVGPTDCFSGSDVCDTALLYLLMDNDNFKTTDLTREKARKLCQLLLEHQIFEPLSGSTSSLERKFDDNSSRYYKFTSTLQQALQGNSSTSNVCTHDAKEEKPSRCNSAPEFLPRPDENMRIRTDTQPELLEGVLSNPATDVVSTGLDCSGNVIQELLGLANTPPSTNLVSNSTAPRPPLHDVKNKHSQSKSTGEQIKKIYTERILQRRTSLDCESVFLNGNLPRTISAGTGTFGRYKRKRSALNLTDESQTDSELDVIPSRCMKSLDDSELRQRRASADPHDWPVYTRSLRPRQRPSLNTERRSHCAQSSSHNNNYPTSLHQTCKKRMRRHSSSVTDVVLSPSQSTADRSVEKLAKLTGEVIFSPAAIAEIRQEIALAQLSQMIDLPILEGLVCAGNQNKEDSGYDNTVFFNVTQQPTSWGSIDIWVRTALSVFDYMKDGHKTTFDYSIGVDAAEYKLALYRSILKSYRARTEPLFPACHEQIHLAVLGLVMSGAEQKAVLVARLASILLPCYLMAEVTTLLEFLHTVSLEPEPKLKTGQNNNDAVLNDFSGIFFMGCKLLSMDQRRILLLLMMRYCQDLTRVPSSVQKSLEKTMQRLKQGDDTPTASILFCNKLTTTQYERQQRDSTEQAIISLVRNVIDDTTISLKDKQKQIKAFKKHHPGVMIKHFSDI